MGYKIGTWVGIIYENSNTSSSQCQESMSFESQENKAGDIVWYTFQWEIEEI